VTLALGERYRFPLVHPYAIWSEPAQQHRAKDAIELSTVRELAEDQPIPPEASYETHKREATLSQ
jgi:hypothetical protein